MSFNALESSRQKGKPVTLYLFVYGDGPGSYYAHTDSEQPITFESRVYQPIPIDRGAYSSSGTLDKSAIEIRTPQNIPLAELFRVYPPSQVVNLFIRQGHINDPDGQFLVCWTGRVLSCSREDNEARFSCEPVSTSLKRNGLRRPYQYGCPHVLYGPQCRADKNAASVIVTAIAVNGAILTLPSGWQTPERAAKYVGGMVQWTSPAGDTVLRTLLRLNAPNVFVVSGRLDSLGAGATVKMTLGCNHQAGTTVQPGGDCHPLHNNILNFGGQPWIPTKNPIGPRSQYY